MSNLSEELVDLFEEIISEASEPDSTTKEEYLIPDDEGQLVTTDVDIYSNHVIDFVDIDDERILEIADRMNDDSERDFGPDSVRSELQYWGFDISDIEFKQPNIANKYGCVCVILEILIEVVEYAGGVESLPERTEKIIDDMLGDYRAEPREIRSICPLLNFISDTDKISLPTSQFETVGLRGHFEVQDLVIKKPSPEERAALYSDSKKRVKGRTLPRNSWSHVVEVKRKTVAGTIYERQILKSLTNCLRLFEPEEGNVRLGPAYDLRDRWTSERLGIPTVGGGSPQEFTVGTQYTRRAQGLRRHEDYNLKPENVSDFVDFWQKYCNLANVNRETKFSNALHRYDQMYSSLFPEDHILNCSIGFEGTLLKDLGTQSSYTFRMILRGGTILDQEVDLDREEIHRFFKNLYFARGQIVHKDEVLADIIEEGNYEPLVADPDPLKVTKLSRRMFSKLIIFYMRQKIDCNNSISETNQEVDELALSVDPDIN
ncbi:hypothetical protein [Halosimplex sp. TS25]|uniref:hypothetical protein n=1 Tax=Halosimplex rarum TaxID=3396619 RepID=UPI0039EC019B